MNGLWCLCDAPLIPYALMKMGMQNDLQVIKAVDYLAGLVRENGWPCKACSQLGKFKGPGKASDPCPYANLIMIQTLAARGTSSDLTKAAIGAETALHLWEDSLNSRPFLFKMGTDFRKLKVPFVWYDILHFADVLSQIPKVRNDKRLDEVIAIIQSKADENGRYRSESIWTKVERLGVLPEERTFALGHTVCTENPEANGKMVDRLIAEAINFVHTQKQFKILVFNHKFNAACNSDDTALPISVNSS